MIASTVGIIETDTIEHVLDFTAYAPPLSAKTVHNDLEEARLTWLSLVVIDKIILWSHQWLWLAHEAGLIAGPVSLSRPSNREFHDYLIQRYGAVGENSLWGIPVEVRE